LPAKSKLHFELEFTYDQSFFYSSLNLTRFLDRNRMLSQGYYCGKHG